MSGFAGLGAGGFGFGGQAQTSAAAAGNPFNADFMDPYRVIGLAQGLMNIGQNSPPVRSFEERLSDPLNNNPTENFADFIGQLSRYGPAAQKQFYPKYGSIPEILYNEAGTKEGKDQFVWSDVWNYQQEQEAARLKKEWENILKRRAMYGNLAQSFSTRGFGPNSGNYATSLGGFSGGYDDIYLKKAQELGVPQSTGGLVNVLKALLSQAPGNVFPNSEDSLF